MTDLTTLLRLRTGPQVRHTTPPLAFPQTHRAAQKGLTAKFLHDFDQTALPDQLRESYDGRPHDHCPAHPFRFDRMG